MTRLAAFVLALASVFVPAVEPAIAQGQAGPLIVQNAWMRAVPGADTAAVYLVLKNTGTQPVIVVGVNSPAASHVMVHETSNVNGQSQMRMHDKLVVAPGQSVSFQPGGLHIMLSGMKKRITIGQTVPLILLLANGGPVQVAAIVRPLDAQ